MTTGKVRRPGGPLNVSRYRSQKSDTLPGRRWEAEIGSIRVMFGEGTVTDAGDLARDLDCRRALLVGDLGVRTAGHLARAEEALRAAGIATAVFEEVGENPTTREVEQGLAVAEDLRPDCIVALGGGSVMDCAKGINFLLTNGGSMADYWGFGRATKPMLPAIGIPTTAGTGSEAQSFALISDAETHRKMACGDPKARFRAVILDPALPATAPPRVATSCGLDAISHAVESFVTTRSNPVSRMLAREAWRLLESSLEASWSRGAAMTVRGDILLAAHLAGAAIEQSMLGAAHACANPLTAAFGVPHGTAVALLLPHTVRYNAEVVADDYRQLVELAGLDGAGSPGELLARRLEQLVTVAGLPQRLQQLGVSKAELPALADSATLEWTARFNPRPVSQAELLSIYEAAY